MHLFAINIYYHSELRKKWGGWKLSQTFLSDSILNSGVDEEKPYATGGEGGGEGEEKGFLHRQNIQTSCKESVVCVITFSQKKIRPTEGKFSKKKVPMILNLLKVGGKMQFSASLKGCFYLLLFYHGK